MYKQLASSSAKMDNSKTSRDRMASEGLMTLAKSLPSLSLSPSSNQRGVGCLDQRESSSSGILGPC